MNPSPGLPDGNRRILLVDDQEQLHEDYRKILALPPLATPEFDALEADFFGSPASSVPRVPTYELTSAFQGREAIELVRKAHAEDRPFALAFVDVRMPPGIDGIETTAQILELDAEIQVIIATAYADYAWEEIYGRFGANDRLLFLRKPFDSTEVHQIASTLAEKWDLARRNRLHQEGLEAAVAARTRELEETLAALESTQGQLIRTEKLASLGRLVAGLAHEINTPVGAIVSSCDSARRALAILRPHLVLPADEPRSTRALETLARAQDTMETASARMAELVAALRRFAHLDRADRQWIDLRDSVRTVLTVLAHELNDRIRVETEFAEVPSIAGHPGEIHQLLLGLLENALEAIAGAGRITIRVRAQEPDVVIEIEDDGRGMSEEQLATLFEVGLETKGPRVQIDWGLTALHQMVRAQGGEIHVESAPGRGTRVTVNLPVVAPTRP